MKYVASLGLVFVLSMVLMAADLESWRRTDVIKTRALQNLAPPPASSFMGWYVTVDKNGEFKMTNKTGLADMGTYWQVRTITKKRHYTAHVLINRGNTKYNGHYLSVDAETGALKMTKQELNTSYWLIRYAGKYQGWDSYYIQNTAETKGVTDMKFLVMDGESGALSLTDEPGEGMNWTFSNTSDLPAETKVH
jgi:hypothetical protein